MADESGDRGEGGWGGRGDSPGFGSERDDPETLDFANVMAEYDKYAAEFAASERAQERPGRFSFTPEFSSRLPEKELYGYQPTFMDKLKIWARDKAIQTGINYATQLAPGVMPTIVGMGRLGFGKYKGATNQELEDQAMSMIMGTITPMSFTVPAIGKTVEKVAKWAGATGGPQLGSGEQPTGPGVGMNPDEQASEFARDQLERRPVDMNLQQAAGPVPFTGKRMDALRARQMDELLRRAKLGRIV